MLDTVINVGFITLDRVALAVIAGVAASWLWLLPPKHAPLPFTAPDLALGLALLMLATASLAELVLRSTVMGEVGITEVWPIIPKVISHSHYGQLWLLRVIVWIGLLLLWLWTRWQGPSRIAHWGTAACGLMIAFFFSASGHAGDNGSFTLNNLVNSLHIASGCIWGGAVIVYTVTVLPKLLRHNIPRPPLANSAIRLSTMAGGALALVLLTGTYNAWQQLDTFSALWTTAYGRLLSIKIVAVLTMMAIGALNRFVIVPSIESWAKAPVLSDVIQDPDAVETRNSNPAQRLLKILNLDIAVFILILATAAALGTQTPPVHAEHRHAMNGTN